MSDAFAAALQALLRERCGLEVLVINHDGATREPVVRCRDREGLGDPYSGYTSLHTVDLENHSFSVGLSYSLHETSGQIESWCVQAAEVPDELVAAIVGLSHLGLSRFSRAHGLEPSVVVNGVKR